MAVIAAIIAGSFALVLLLSVLTRVHPAAYGCVFPVAAAVLVLIAITLWPSGSSTDAIAIPMAFIYAASGSIPGALIGGWIRARRRKPSA